VSVERAVTSGGYLSVAGQPPCLSATFHRPGDNPFFAAGAVDDRGTLYGLDFAVIRPHLVEVIHCEPRVVRGNHVHRYCAETFTVLSGEVTMYLLCTCPDKHLFAERMMAGTTVQIPPGAAHAIYAGTRSECVAVFGDGDPRIDRDRVILLEY
jgi:mannose-6-phosphate isomerase-like protein (cupin superfamily)